MVGSLLRAGVGCLVQIPVVRELAGEAAEKAAKVLKTHWTGSSRELGYAFQDSYRCAMVSIASGLVAEQQANRLWQALSEALQLVVESRVSREFSERLQAQYLLPFAQQTGLSGKRLAAFRSELITICQACSQQGEQILDVNLFAEPDWAELVSGAFSLDISDVLLERIQTVRSLHRLQSDFLGYEGLLGDAVLHFFREKMRQNERLEKTLAALQREGLWADVRDLQAAQQQMQASLQQQLEQLQAQIVASQGDFVKLGELVQVGQRTQQRLAVLPAQLREAQDSWQAYGTRLEQFEQRFGSWCEVVSLHLRDVMAGITEVHREIVQTKEAAQEAARVAGRAEDAAKQAGQKVEVVGEQIVDGLGDVSGQVAELSGTVAALIEMMRHLHLELKVKARDEFTQHNRRSLALIQQAVGELERLPRTSRGYSMAAMAVGSALSSTGDLARSTEVLLAAREASQNTEERALASYNLFQVYLRQGQYNQALEALLHAAQLDRTRYLLFDMDRYIPQQLLGAGGMGCAFLCRDEWEDSLVVVKSFWETRPGSLQEVFREAYLMRDLAGEYIPRPLNRAYAYPGLQKHPFIVMEYIPNTIDGEAWLAQHGKMSLIEGLQVGIQVAKGLDVAHQAGVSHLDLKPGNLLLRRVGEAIEVKIIDFGLARVATSLKQEAVAKSRSGKSIFAQEIFGTLDYAPPEQLGEVQYGQPGPRSDLFAFGATLYRLMSHENPRTINPSCLPENKELHQVFMECMMRDPARRPGSAVEVVRRLEAILVQASSSPEDRYRTFLGQQLVGRKMLESGDEIDLVSEAIKFGLRGREGQEILRAFLQEVGISRRREAEAENRRQQEEEARRRREEAARQEKERARQRHEEQARQQRQQMFTALWQEAKTLVESNAEAALAKIKEAESFAPELCNTEFTQWKEYIQQELAKPKVPTILIPGGGQMIWEPGQKPGEVRELPGIPDAALVWCPPGSFMMGSPESDKEAYSDEKPQHQVTLTRGFWIWQTPVTQAQFAAVMYYNPARFKEVDTKQRIVEKEVGWLFKKKEQVVEEVVVGQKTRPHHPVEQVSWHEAAAFCSAVSRKLGLPKCFDMQGQGENVVCSLKAEYSQDYYGCSGFRLPTEAEWEYACRAGSTEARYGELDAIAWYNKNSNKSTHPVKQLDENAWNLYDTLGSVWEWCWGWYEDYSGGAVTDPAGSGGGSDRVRRGGSWSLFARGARAAWRNWSEPSRRSADLGFRPVWGSGPKK